MPPDRFNMVRPVLIILFFVLGFIKSEFINMLIDAPIILPTTRPFVKPLCIISLLPTRFRIYISLAEKPVFNPTPGIYHFFHRLFVNQYVFFAEFDFSIKRQKRPAFDNILVNTI